MTPLQFEIWLEVEVSQNTYFITSKSRYFFLVKIYPGLILESKGMQVIFQKKGKKYQKRVKYLKIWAKHENI